MSLIETMKKYKCEKCNSHIQDRFVKEEFLACNCKETNAFVSSKMIEFVIKDFVFTIEKESKDSKFDLRAHQISVESEYGSPLISSHDENEIINKIDSFLVNSIFY